jgi:hypothetical protein
MPLRSCTRTHTLHRKLLHAARVMGPTLIAFAFAGVAHAQGTMDFSGAQTLMTTFKTTIYLHLSSKHLSATSSPLDALALATQGEALRSV